MTIKLKGVKHYHTEKMNDHESVNNTYFNSPMLKEPIAIMEEVILYYSPKIYN